MPKINRITCALILLLFLVNTLSAQVVSIDKKLNIDSLSAIINAKSPDSVKARASFLLSEYWISSNPKLSQQYLDKGRKLGSSNSFLKALSFYYEGRLEYELHHAAKCSDALLKSEKLLGGIHSEEAARFRRTALYYYAENLYSEGKDKAVIATVLNLIIPLTVAGKDTLLMAKSYGVLHKTFNDNSHYNQANLYIDRAIALMKKIDPQGRLLVAYYLRSAFTACYQYKFDKVKKILELTKNLLKKFPDSKEMLDNYEVEGIYFMEGTRESDKALASLDKGQKLARKMGNEYKVTTFLLQKYNVYLNNSQYDKGIPILMEVSKNVDFMKYALNKQSIYREFNRTYELLGDVPNAYIWLKKYNQLTDSLNETRLRKDINELEVKFRNAENQKKIVELNAANSKANLTVKNNRLMSWLFAIISFALLLILIFGWIVYRNAKKMSVQKEITHQQELKDLKQQEEIKLTKAMLQGQEEERKRIARDLHDGLGGMLAGIKLNLSEFAISHEEERDGSLDPIINQLDTSVTELRRIAHNMMPETLLKFGLETSLRDLCNAMTISNISIHFQSYGLMNDLVMQEQISIYRIIQELLGNAVKHAKATQILLQCSYTAGSFLITVEDDGIGFDVKELENKTGMGLLNIRNRVSYLNGIFEINTNKGQQGTTINIELNVRA
ncbi:sensor histidine kinase [Pedobacter sp.]|uniref:sensor histidine kinase n=1 Tax=Pedobacter sp. TaxID=1411316 RepID=UPI003BABFA48